MTKVVFLNGPPKSGKDTAANFLELEGPFPTDRYKFAEPLRRMVPEMFGLSPKEWLGYIEGEEKDKPQDRLLGWTPRQLQIIASEEWIKPTFGQDFFGQVLKKKIENADVPPELAVISDSGFLEEAMPIVNHFRPENCILIRLYRSGCSFEGDSRDYIMIDGVTQETIYNNGNFNYLYSELFKIVEDLGCNRN